MAEPRRAAAGCLALLLWQERSSLQRVSAVPFPPQLLTVNPEHRFSCLAHIQASAQLSAVVWSDVCEKRVEPAFVPNVSRGRVPVPSGAAPQGHCESRGFLRGGGV